MDDQLWTVSDQKLAMLGHLSVQFSILISIATSAKVCFTTSCIQRVLDNVWLLCRISGWWCYAYCLNGIKSICYNQRLHPTDTKWPIASQDILGTTYVHVCDPLTGIYGSRVHGDPLTGIYSSRVYVCDPLTRIYGSRVHICDPLTGIYGSRVHVCDPLTGIYGSRVYVCEPLTFFSSFGGTERGLHCGGILRPTEPVVEGRAMIINDLHVHHMR